jgi:hypothetical protein
MTGGARGVSDTGQSSLSTPRHADREAREAQVEVRFAPLILKHPRCPTARRATLMAYGVEVLEPNPPPGETLVHYRWLIERFHFVLKSGCRLEERQLRELDGLERLLAVFSQVAWHLLRLTYQARLTPDAPCTVVLQTYEWHALYAFRRGPQSLPSWEASWLAKAIVNPLSKFSSEAGPAFKTSLLLVPSFNPLPEMWIMHSYLERGAATVSGAPRRGGEVEAPVAFDEGLRVLLVRANNTIEIGGSRNKASKPSLKV